MNQKKHLKLQWRKSLTVSNQKLLLFTPTHETKNFEFNPSKSLIVNMGSRIVRTKYIKNLNNSTADLTIDNKLALISSNSNINFSARYAIARKEEVANVKNNRLNNSGVALDTKKKKSIIATRKKHLDRLYRNSIKNMLQREVKQRKIFTVLMSDKRPLIGSHEVDSLYANNKFLIKPNSNSSNVLSIQKENIILRQFFDLRDKMAIYNKQNLSFLPKLSSKSELITIEEIIESANQLTGITDFEIDEKITKKIESNLTTELLIEFKKAVKFIQINLKKIKRTHSLASETSAYFNPEKNENFKGSERFSNNQLTLYENKEATRKNILSKLFIDEEGVVTKFKDHMLKYSKFDPKLATYYSIGYNYNKKSQRTFRNKSFSMNNLINDFFYTESTLISRPIFIFNSGNIDVKLFYFLPKFYAPITNDVLNKYNKKRKIDLSFKKRTSSFLIKDGKKIKLPNSISFNPNYLNHLIQFGVGLISHSNRAINLNLTRLVYPQHNSQILAKFIGINANFYRFRRIIKLLFRKITIPKIRPWDRKKNRTLMQSSLIKKNMAKPLTLNMKNKINTLLFGLRGVKNEELNYLSEMRLATKFNQGHSEGFLNNSKFISPFNPQARSDKNNSSILNPILTRDIKNQYIMDAQPLDKGDLVSFIFGIRIKLAGRILSERFKPRYTVSSKQKGYIANSRSHVLDIGRYTGKNKRGAFSISVKINHDDHLN